MAALALPSAGKAAHVDSVLVTVAALAALGAHDSAVISWPICWCGCITVAALRSSGAPRCGPACAKGAVAEGHWLWRHT